MIEKNLINFINDANWRFAKTMPHIPHFYIRRSEHDKIMFELFIEEINKNGIEEKFFKKKYKYLHLEVFKYWVMDENKEDVQIINRAKI